jgi:hypothetical protein
MKFKNFLLSLIISGFIFIIGMIALDCYFITHQIYVHEYQKGYLP